MMGGMLIVTATGADVKLVNRILTWLKDWESGSDIRFRVLRTRDEATCGIESEDEPPLQEFTVNEWEGLSVAEVERVMIQRERDTPESRGSNYLFLLLDDSGVRDQTIIIAEIAWNATEDNEINYLEHFNKVRVPWIEAYLVWCNLEIANLSFDEYCTERSREETTDFWWHYRPVFKKEYYERYISQAEAAVKELEEMGVA